MAAKGITDKEKEAIMGLQKLREQQKNIVYEMARVEDDKREHERVLEVLRKMECSRRCYRMVGNTLAEYEVGSVIPVLESTLSNLTFLDEKLKERLVEKGKELNEYTEKHHIRFLTEKEIAELAPSASSAK